MSSASNRAHSSPRPPNPRSVPLITCTPLALERGHYRLRLLNVVRSVEEFDHSRDKVLRGQVYMRQYRKSCGSPACALGHYAMRKDLQSEFKLGRDGRLYSRVTQEQVDCEGWEVQLHFGLTWKEVCELFSSDGCGVALSWGQDKAIGVPPERVVNYLRTFAAKKYPQWSAAL